MAPAPRAETLTTTQIAALLRELIGVTGPRSKVPLGAFRRVHMLVESGNPHLPHSVTAAVYGILDSLGRGVLPGQIAEQVRAHRSDWEWCTFIAETAAHCTVPGDVTAYLRERFAPAAQEDQTR